MRTTRLLFILLSVLLTLPGCGKRISDGHPAVVGGTVEPDFRYPWAVVIQSGCRGVLIHPKWVLTAAHCILPNEQESVVAYHRTDPFTGSEHVDSRPPGGPQPQGVFIHPQYNDHSLENDIVLIRLREPFDINPYLQTAALPSSPLVPGVVGTVASFSHTDNMLPPDKVAVFRAPLPPQSLGRSFLIDTTDATGSLCQGDSGSGFVTIENGRATVRGILSQASGDCVTPSGHVVSFMDVFAYRDWIFQTIRMDDSFLAGNTRVRRSGRAARGVMGVGCPNAFGTMWGPLNVFGVEEGANCESGQSQTVVCSLSGGAAGPRTMAITGFTMKTDCAPHGTTVQSLPFTATWASFSGPAPVHPDPFGICRRDFTCQISLVNNVADPEDGGVFSQ